MIDLTQFWKQADIGAALLIIAVLLFFIFLAKFPEPKKRSPKR